jgi:NADH:ubiquinone oxidoreductase subunit
MDGFRHFTAFGGLDGEEKLATRRVVFARSTNVSSSNCTQHAWMHEAVQGRPANVVFNLDEVQISDWEDRQRKKVVVPRTAALHSIHHRLSRSVKHISVVACVSASGTCLTPYMVTS